MKHSITCQCEHVFSVEIPDIIDLDEDPTYINTLMDGTFLSVPCPSCGTPLKPEFPINVRWRSHGFEVQVLPEFDRLSFYRDKQRPVDREVLIGYPELADRVTVIKEELDPMAIEAIKYYLLVKAEESNPDTEISAWFQGKNNDFLEFHLHGIMADQVAVSRLPLSLYEKTLAESQRYPEKEPFASLRWGPYLSVENLRRPEELQ